MNIQVIQKDFDLNLYEHHIRTALHMNQPMQTKVTKLKLLVQRAYEQGVMDAKQDKDYYDRTQP